MIKKRCFEFWNHLNKTERPGPLLKDDLDTKRTVSIKATRFELLLSQTVAKFIQQEID
jgi:hypothetical protein